MILFNYMGQNNSWHNLYIVSTPIGNLGDITIRALEIFKSVPYIFCEDTRVSLNLMNHFGIKSKLISYHQHSKESKVNQIIEILKESDAALITDAGTPGISDPGNKLIEEIVSASKGKCNIIPIPGASAVIAGLSVSGLPTDKYYFMGFVPHKKGKETFLKAVADSEVTTVFYESTHRILKTLQKLSTFIDDNRKAVVCRELTKKFETVYRGSIREILMQLENDVSKGEFVVIVSGG